MSGKPKPPNDLSIAAKRIWNQLYEQCDVDAPAELLLATICRSWDRIEQVRKIIAAEGVLIQEKTANGNVKLKPHPAIAIEHAATAQMARCWHLMGWDAELPAGLA